MGAGRGTVLPGGVQVVRLGDDRLHNAGWASYILRFLFGRLLESRPYRVMRALGLECRSLAHRIQSQHKKPCWVLPLDAGCDPLSSPEEERQRRIRSQGRIDCIEAQCASRPWMTLLDLEIFVLGWNEAERWLCGNPGTLPYRQDKRWPCNSNPNQSRRDYTPATPSNSVMSQTHKSSKKFATPSPELPYGEVNCLECGRCMYIGQLIPMVYEFMCKKCGAVNVFQGSIQPLLVKRRPAQGDSLAVRNDRKIPEMAAPQVPAGTGAPQAVGG